MPEETTCRVAVIICAGTEWRAVCAGLPAIDLQTSPLGEWFITDLGIGERLEPVLFFHTGWGKIAAAASTQYVIDRWSPPFLFNLGTCGGFEGEVERGTVILAERTIVYDIVNQIGDYKSAIAHYTTDIDLSWLGECYPQGVCRSLLVSGDRDLLAKDVPRLKAQFGAVAGDWESGAIAYVAARNSVKCLILRGVTDLVGSGGGEAYGNYQLYAENTRKVMAQLMQLLPALVAQAVGQLKLDDRT